MGALLNRRRYMGKVDGGILPPGYTQLVGIKNTSTAYLPISVPLGTNVRYEFESMGNSAHFSWNTSGNKEIIIFNSGSTRCYLNGAFSAPSFSTTTRYKIAIDLARESEYARAYIDDLLVRETAVNINTGSSIQLFRDANRGNNLRITIYAFKAYSGESLVNDYIPAMRKSDNKVGVYDIASNEFITSPNGVDFVAVT